MEYYLETDFCPLNEEDALGCGKFIYWTHANCGGKALVNHFGKVKCLKCGLITQFEELLFKCPSHTFYHTIDIAKAKENILKVANLFAAFVADHAHDYDFSCTFIKKLKRKIGPM